MIQRSSSKLFPRPHELLLQEKVKLYDNIAQINDCQGRLLAELQIYPSPGLNWQFETLGEVQCDFPSLYTQDGTPLSPIEGYYFSLESPYLMGESSDAYGPVQAIRGIASRAVYGDVDAHAHKFVFCLPNTRLQSEVSFQGLLQKIVREQPSGREVQQSEEGRCVDLELDDFWSIRLVIKRDASDWLKIKNRNIGTLVTTIGELYQRKYRATEPETFSELEAITLSDALTRLNTLGKLLSYANGGFIAPLYVEGRRYSENREELIRTTAIVIQSPQVTTLERLGNSWVENDSSLATFIACFPAFERMLQQQFWRDTFDFFSIKYFQAIQNGSWQVVASEIGAVLERLSYTILVEEEIDSNRRGDFEILFDLRQSQQARRRWNLGSAPGQEDISPTGKRLKLLLEKIGLSVQRGYSDGDKVQFFLDVRNDSVHPRVSSIAITDRWRSIRQAIQWADEVMLWRLGYSGRYLDRTQDWQTSTRPRYDLSTRTPDW
jgi:hypothetical protein